LIGRGSDFEFPTRNKEVEDGSACVGGKKKVRKTGNEKGRSGWISDGERQWEENLF